VPCRVGSTVKNRAQAGTPSPGRGRILEQPRALVGPGKDLREWQSPGPTPTVILSGMGPALNSDVTCPGTFWAFTWQQSPTLREIPGKEAWSPWHKREPGSPQAFGELHGIQPACHQLPATSPRGWRRTGPQPQPLAPAPSPNVMVSSLVNL
jgi:hypothetical protein